MNRSDCCAPSPPRKSLTTSEEANEGQVLLSPSSALSEARAAAIVESWHLRSAILECIRGPGLSVIVKGLAGQSPRLVLLRTWSYKLHDSPRADNYGPVLSVLFNIGILLFADDTINVLISTPIIEF